MELAVLAVLSQNPVKMASCDCNRHRSMKCSDVRDTIILNCIKDPRTLSSGMLSRRYHLQVSAGALYRVALFRTDVSENIGFHSCITVETLLLCRESIPEDSVLRRLIVFLYGEAQ
jgi:hypothetical protein